MNPVLILKDYYKKSKNVSDIKVNKQTNDYIKEIANRISQNKGVYTVLITLAVYKVINPKQDIRQHKKVLPNGFSGRSFDTNYITPTLQELNLPAMMESGWLTRSLEQAASFDFDFPGRITPITLKNAFLYLVNEIQKGEKSTEDILRLLLNKGIEFMESNKIEIKKIANPDTRIDNIIHLLKEHFTTKYGVHGGAKLPMLAFYAIYKILVPEMGRFKECKLLPLGSLTACDKNSNSAGDIQIEKNKDIFEAVEIKLDKPITPITVRNAFQKINKFNVRRYYILSGIEPRSKDMEEINQIIFQVQQEQGCQIIVNGFYQSLKYYLRLIENPQDFLNNYIKLVEDDKELDKSHKEKLQKLLSDF